MSEELKHQKEFEAALKDNYNLAMSADGYYSGPTFHAHRGFVAAINLNANRLEQLEELSDCPPDCSLDKWVKGLANILSEANEMRVKVHRLDAVILAAEQKIHLCDKLAKSVLDPQGLAHARGSSGAAERLRKTAKGESDG